MFINSSLLIICIVSFALFTFFSLIYFQSAFNVKKNFSIKFCLAIIINLLILMSCTYFRIYQLGILILLFSFFLWFILLYQLSVKSSFLCANLVILFFYISMGISVFIVSSFSNYSIFSLSLSLNLAHTRIIIIISSTLPLLFGYLTKITYVSEARLNSFFRNKSQHNFVLVFNFALLIFLMLINDGRSLQLPPIWFNSLYISSLLLALFLLFLITKNSLQVSYLIESELRSYFLENQLERQLQHYRTYQKYSEDFKIMKHDYNKIMTSLKVLIDNNDLDRAKLLFEDIDNQFKNKSSQFKKYSNNLLVDAVLFDTANVCVYNSIHFNASVNISESLHVKDLDIVRIVSNLTDNALEAASKIDNVENRFIKIIGKKANNSWYLLEFSNSYQGALTLIKTNHFLTTKENSDMHGLGISIVINLVEKNGGLIEFDSSSKANVFIVKILFPLQLQQ